MRTCKICLELKPKSDFYVVIKKTGALSSYCIKCHNAKTNADARRRREENAERERELARARYALKPEQYRSHAARWRGNNPAIVKSSNRKTKLKLYDTVCARNAERARRLKEATPPWVDKADIADWYEAAKIAEAVSGEKWHVDHIHPLKGRGFCGLHVGYNLQLLPASKNCRKGNRLEKIS